MSLSVAMDLATGATCTLVPATASAVLNWPERPDKPTARIGFSIMISRRSMSAKEGHLSPLLEPEGHRKRLLPEPAPPSAVKWRTIPHLPLGVGGPYARTPGFPVSRRALRARLGTNRLTSLYRFESIISRFTRSRRGKGSRVSADPVRNHLDEVRAKRGRSRQKSIFS